MKFIYLALLLFLLIKVQAQSWASADRRCEYFLTPENVNRPLHILITAGGTKEPLDDVRFISNFSSGAFGRSFALAAVARGHHVVLLAPKELPKLAGELPPGVELRPYFSTNDLKIRLEQAATERIWDVVLHSAAVSDYTPAQVENGKISSSQEELVIRLVKTPKLIQSFRELFGKSFLVGFKLLSGVPEAERYEVAMKQLKTCRTNLCIENDLKEISKKSHKIRLITPEGGAIAVPVADKNTVAASAMNFIEKRVNVHWFKTVQDASLPQKSNSDLPGRLLNLAQDAGLLPNESGNISVRINPDGLFAITPRGKNKSTLLDDEIIPVKVDLKERKILTNSSIKPSIDSSVAGALYTRFPEITATLHSHSPWFLGGDETRFPFPCGVKEEGDEIIRTVLLNRKFEDDQSFIVRLIDHGSLLGVGRNLSVEKLERQWEEAKKDLEDHYTEVGLDFSELAGGKSVAIVAKEGIIGIIRIHSDGSVSPRIHPKYQGSGYGRELVQRIRDLKLNIKTVNECNVLDFYKNKGFKVVSAEGRSLLMQPVFYPAVESAVAVIQRADGSRLLLLRGQTDPVYPNYWSLAGGKVEANETVEEALIREIKEETGLDVKIIKKIGVEESYNMDIERKYVLHGYLVEAITNDIKLSYEHSKYIWLKNLDEQLLEPMGVITKKFFLHGLNKSQKE